MGFGATQGYAGVAKPVCNVVATVKRRVGRGVTLTLQHPTVATQVT